jgi:hypothetical protein
VRLSLWGNSLPVQLRRVDGAPAVAALLSQVAALARLGLSPSFCAEHLESGLQGIWLRARGVAAVLAARLARGEGPLAATHLMGLMGIAARDEALLLVNVACTLVPIPPGYVVF